MKKWRSFCVMVLLLVLLSGCGSRESRSVDALIDAIGAVDADCGPVLEYVRNAYESLSEEDKTAVKQYELLLRSEAAYVDILIQTIGTVTPESVRAISAARQAYDALLPEAQELVSGIQALQTAEEICTVKTLEASLVGVWVNEVLGNVDTQIGRSLIRSYGLDETNCDPQFGASGSFELKHNGAVSFDGEEVGTWTLSENNQEVMLETTSEVFSLQIFQEDGFTKLVGSAFGNPAFGYVKEQDYAAAFQAKYHAVELNRDTILSYIGEPVLLGKLETDQGKKHNAYLYPSQVYDDGLVYLGSTGVIRVDYVHGGKPDYFWLDVPVFSTTKLKMKDVCINTQMPVSGEIYYVKSDHVTGNYIDEDGFRVLRLTNGISILFDGYSDTLNTFWSRMDISYSDYMY